MSKQRTVTPTWLDVLLLAVAVSLLAVALSPLAGSSGPKSVETHRGDAHQLKHAIPGKGVRSTPSALAQCEQIATEPRIGCSQVPSARETQLPCQAHSI